MSTTVSYKGQNIATVSNNTKTLETEGKYLEADVILTDSSIIPSGTYTVSSSGTADITNYASLSVPSGSAGSPALSVSEVTNHSVTVRASTIRTAGWIPSGTVQGASRNISASDLVSGTKSITQNGTGIDVTNYASVDVAVPSGQPNLQAKTNIAPTTSSQTITADSGYDGLSSVQINAMPSGSATPASSISGTSATVSTGTNTLTLSKTVSNTPQVSAGYVSSGTAGNSSVSLTANVTTKAAATIYPSASDQSIASSTYLTGAQTIKGVTYSNLTAANIKKDVVVTIGDSADADRILSVTGTYSGGGGTLTVKTATTTKTSTGQTISFSSLSGEPKYWFLRITSQLSSSGSTTYYYITDLFYDGTNIKGNSFRIGSTRRIYNITSGISQSYSGGTLTITGGSSTGASPGQFYGTSNFGYELVYIY